MLHNEICDDIHQPNYKSKDDSNEWYKLDEPKHYSYNASNNQKNHRSPCFVNVMCCGFFLLDLCKLCKTNYIKDITNNDDHFSSHANPKELAMVYTGFTCLRMLVSHFRQGSYPREHVIKVAEYCENRCEDYPPKHFGCTTPPI